MTTNKPKVVTVCEDKMRAEFEDWWKATMNTEAMDLHRCEFPMTRPENQPYACHEANRAWMAWQASRAPLALATKPRLTGANGGGFKFVAKWDGSDAHKPEVVAWKVRDEIFHSKEDAVAASAFHSRHRDLEPLIRLSDYEALQAECERWKNAASGVQQWQPIGTCPRHVDVLFYREDAGVFSGKFTDADSFMTDKERDEWVGTEEEMFDLDAWSYEPEGVYRMDGDLVPTHWMPLPAPPATQGANQ